MYMGDYLRSELLDRISAAEASFLIRTSVLDRMCGPLCDAILGAKGSAAVLEQMEAGTCWWSRSTAAASGTGSTT